MSQVETLQIKTSKSQRLYFKNCTTPSHHLSPQYKTSVRQQITTFFFPLHVLTPAFCYLTNAGVVTGPQVVAGGIEFRVQVHKCLQRQAMASGDGPAAITCDDTDEVTMSALSYLLRS
jgi:hypothetical protein